MERSTDREKVISHLNDCMEASRRDNIWVFVRKDIVEDAFAMLKEPEAVVKQWTKEIANNQIAHAPKDSHEFMSLNEHLENEYKRGIWDGLQIAWNIISEGR